MDLDCKRGDLTVVDEEEDHKVISSVLAVRTSLGFSPTRFLAEWSMTPKTDQILWLLVMVDDLLADDCVEIGVGLKGLAGLCCVEGLLVLTWVLFPFDGS